MVRISILLVYGSTYRTSLKVLLAKLLKPIKRQIKIFLNWIRSTVWPPKCWSVFMQSIRTNNDIEGWHHSLNRRAAGRCGLPLYKFVALLHKEVGLVSVQIRLVSERKLNAEGHVPWSAEVTLRTLGGLQQEGEVTEAAAQRICKYQQASNALNWT